MPFILLAGPIVLLLSGVGAATARMAQLPEKAENLQVLPKDITPEALTQRMREFSFALNVRCQHCHTGGDGVSFEGVDFKSDEKPAKRKARQMLRMVEEINSRLLPAVPDRADPPVRVDCVTCHHGMAIPKTLAAVLSEVIVSDGAAAAVTRYRQLRETALFGRYDLSEWSVNELARALQQKGDTASAVTILEMNAEFNPKSSAIDRLLAELHRTRGERDKALARYKLAIEKSPKDDELRKRVAEYEARP